jgi:ComF family protein
MQATVENHMHRVWKHVWEIVFPAQRQFALLNHLEPYHIAEKAVRTKAEATLPVLAPFPYDHALVRDAIHAAKYYAHERAALLLGAALADFVAEELAERRMFGTYHNSILVPMPLHSRRQRERGFNQSERIAQALHQALSDDGIVLESSSLKRIKYTAPQAHQTSRLGRSTNVRGSFAVPSPGTIRGKDVLLLDDVVTTGATMHAAREALRLAGARDVMLVAAAH